MKSLSFNSLTIKYSGLATAIITDANISEAYNPEDPPNSLPLNKIFKALWDTGATGTVISEKAASKLDLVPSGKKWIQHAGGKEEKNTYLINLNLPSGLTILGIQATEYPSANQHDIIIGMDVINKGDFSITNVDAKTWMSFRIPSIQSIDYVKESKNYKTRSIRRNDPCPCNSGQKFKKCNCIEFH